MKVRSLLVLLLLLSTQAMATVEFPMLDIQNTAGDIGFSTDGSAMNIDASLIAELYAPGDGTAVAGDVSITADLDQVLNPSQFLYNNGSLSIVDNGEVLLSATFSDLTISVLNNTAFLAATLTYTGGLYAAGLTDGTLEGSLFQLNASDLAGVAQAATTIIKVGSVTAVPLPLSIYLLGSGLLVLFRLARRS